MDTETITLTADDGHELQAYIARPDDTPKGGIVVIQEIFGLTNHIRSVTENFAAQGYLAFASAMVYRSKPDIVLCWIWILIEKCLGRQQHAGGTETALHGTVGNKGLLQGV